MIKLSSINLRGIYMANKEQAKKKSAKKPAKSGLKEKRIAKKAKRAK